MNPQHYQLVNVRSAAILTGSYVAGNVIGPKGTAGTNAADANPIRGNQLILLVDFTIGSLDDAQIKVEFSHDGTTYYQETFSAVSSGVSTETLGVHKFTATGKYRIAIPIKDANIRVSAIGTGTATSSSMKIDAILGTA